MSIGSFFSGLSGLRANQTKLEVIGNNIANANTVGFKASRITFGDVLSRTLRSATSATAPQQVGRGTQIIAISTITRQGGIQESGLEGDLAIQGRGFFIVSDGEREFYTRAGNFSINGNGEMTTSDGLLVQGFNAVDGQIPVSAVKEGIRLPSEPLPARATTSIGLQGNLSSATPIIALDVDGNPIRLGGIDGIIGTAIPGSVSMTDNGTEVTLTGSGTTFTNLNVGDTLIVSGRRFTIANIIDDTTLTLDRPTLSGTIEATAGSSTIIGTDTRFLTELRVGDTINVDGQDVTILSIQSDTQLTISAPVQNDVAAGTPLEFGQTAGLVTIQGQIAETPDAPPAATQLADLPSHNFPMSVDERANLLVKNTITGEQIVVTVRGDQTVGDLEAAIRQGGFTTYNLNADGFRISKLDPSNGTATSIQIVDSLGNQHLGIMTFFRTEDPGTWVWQLNIPDAEAVAQDPALDFDVNTRGTVQFNPDGSLQTFQNFAGSEQFSLRFSVGGDAELVAIEMNRDTVSKLTQYSLASDIAVERNNGSLPGELVTFNVDSEGRVIGSFSNGETRVLAQLLIADFTNPQGLIRAGANSFTASVNSGDPVIGTPGQGNFGTIVAGALELSNVDLAEEFIDMILAQRGLQSSANVITTGDTIMNDVLNLKRG